MNGEIAAFAFAYGVFTSGGFSSIYRSEGRANPMLHRVGLTVLLLVSCVACLAMVARAVGPNHDVSAKPSASAPQP